MINHLDKISFGEIDGYGDPQLEKYFLDNDYWLHIVENPIFYVIGKKGTGKSSIYQMIETQAIERGDIVTNKDFGEFPFEKLLKLNDENFAKPNQYQTIWKSVIYNLYIQAISQLQDESNQYFCSIKKYYTTFFESVTDLHKETITNITKKNGGLYNSFLSLNKEKELAESFSLQEENITRLNNKLEDLIVNFLITRNGNQRIIIQFDRLDDNYNQYQDTEEFYQSIISLFKVVYSFNQKLRMKHVNNSKVVIYLRSDILRELSYRDSESARWFDFCFILNWNIPQLKNYKDSMLYKMVMKRIHTSSPELKDKTFDEIFGVTDKFKEQCYIKFDLFSHLVLQTLFRPRDLIKLCKTLQIEVQKHGRLDIDSYNTSIKKYADWLVNTELANEINPILKSDFLPVVDLLKACGSRVLTVAEFSKRYYTKKYNFKLSIDDMLKFLYNTGIIENIWKVYDKKKKKEVWQHRSIFRNEGDFDRNLNFKIFNIIWIGLTV